MKAKEITLSILITLVLGLLVFFVGAAKETLASPVTVYQVYLNGKKIGLLNSKEDFLSLVDKKQDEIKKKYGVDKVYPPSGIKIEEIVTYESDVKTSAEIYDIIDDTDPFTIDGYIVTIKYKDPNKAPVYIYTLSKDYFKTAMKNTIAAFTGTDALNAYENDKQSAIKDTGERIESIYWDEDITVKKGLISTEENIFANENDLSKYILFGTLDEQKKYSVKDGDSIDDIIEDNNLSIEEFLIANPTIPNKNVLLTKDQEVTIGLISPIVTIIHEKEVVEEVTNNFKIEYQEDSKMAAGTKKVIQEGTNGLSRVTEQIQYQNGAIQQLVITKTEEIKPTVNQIVARGTKTSNWNYTYINTGNDDWYWPTVSPYIITSRYGYRWGKLHDGIDISGCGFGSPIYSATDGIVIETENGCNNYGSYGNTCGGGFGNAIKVSILDGKYTVIYAHLTKNLKVKVGDTISRGDNIGFMGDSGSSTGTHLHFEIDNASGTSLNPCKVAFSC